MRIYFLRNIQFERADKIIRRPDTQTFRFLSESVASDNDVLDMKNGCVGFETIEEDQCTISDPNNRCKS